MAELRISHLIAGLDTGGAEMMLLKLIRFSKGSFAHSVISLNGMGPIANLIQAEGVPVFPLNWDPKLKAITKFPCYVRKLHQLRPDVVQGWMYHGNLAASLGVLVGNMACPVAWSVRCTIGNFRNERTASRAMVCFSALMSKGVSSIIYNSTRSKQEHEAAGFRPRRSGVIPNGFDIAQFCPASSRREAERERLGLSSQDMVIGTVARLHPMKDPSNLVHAAVQISRVHQNAKFVMAGRDIPRLRVVFPELGPEIDRLGSRLVLLPEQRDVTSLLSAFDIFVLPSAWGEGFSNSLGEAMAMGLPCVATDVGEAAQMLKGAGRIVPIRQPMETAEAVLELLSDRTVRERLGAAARMRIVANYKIETISHSYQSEWLSLASSR